MKIRRLTDTGEWTTRRYLSLLGTLLIWGIVAIDAWYLWPTQLGGDTSIVVVSGKSMEPTYFGGDLVIARKMEPSVGDVIVYAPEGFGGSQIVHRIVGGDAADGWVMQGDNNPREDPFTPKAGEIRGVVLVHYSNFGRVTVLLLNPMVWAFVLLAAMVLMLWYTGDDCDDRDQDEDEDEKNENENEGDGDPESKAEDEPDLIDRVVEGAEAAVSRMVASSVAAGAAAFAGLTSRARVLRPVSLVPVRVSAILGVVGLLAVSSMSPASASSLAINTGGTIFTKSYAPCTTATLGVTYSGTATAGTNYPSIAITGLAGCVGLTLSYTAYSATGQTVAAGTNFTVVAGTNVFSSGGTYDASLAQSVLVKVNGWPITNTWTAPTVPIPSFSCIPVNKGSNDVPGNGQWCTVTDVILTQWAGGKSNQYQYQKVTFSVTSSTADFLVSFDFGDSAKFGTWPAGMPTRVWSNGNAIKAAVPTPAYSCSSLPTVSLNRNVALNPSDTSYEIQASNDPDAWVGVGAPSAVCL